jgi:hypothetical protein
MAEQRGGLQRSLGSLRGQLMSAQLMLFASVISLYLRVHHARQSGGNSANTTMPAQPSKPNNTGTQAKVRTR